MQMDVFLSCMLPHLPLRDLLNCRRVCQGWKLFFSPERLLSALRVPPVPGRDALGTLRAMYYMDLFRFFDTHAVLAHLKLARLRSAWTHVLQGFVRSVYYEGSYDEGTLKWLVQPSSAWTKKYVVSWTVVDHTLVGHPVCQCVCGCVCLVHVCFANPLQTRRLVLASACAAACA